MSECHIYITATCPPSLPPNRIIAPHYQDAFKNFSHFEDEKF